MTLTEIIDHLTETRDRHGDLNVKLRPARSSERVVNIDDVTIEHNYHAHGVKVAVIEP